MSSLRGAFVAALLVTFSALSLVACGEREAPDSASELAPGVADREQGSSSSLGDAGAPDPASVLAGKAGLPDRVMSPGNVPLAILEPLQPKLEPDPEPGSPPRLEIDGLEGPDPVDEWGLIHPDGRTRRTYALRNHGGSPLNITIASGGCGCTQVKLGGAVIAPRDVVTMSVTYRPDKDQKARGQTDVVKSVTIWSDDAARPTFGLGIRAQFEPPGPEMK